MTARSSTTGSYGDLGSPQGTAGLLALLSLKGVGPKTALRFASFADQRESFLAERSLNWDRLLEEALQELERLDEHGVRSVSIFDADYPARLRGIQDPPLVLFLHGSLQALHSRRVVAVVGTREPTEFGCSATEEIVTALADENWVVVSGLALGIDGIAHGSALKHHASTVAVLAAGLDRIYPKQHEEMAKAIVDCDGALVSEQRWGTPPARANFVRRNRIQTGLSAAVVVTQTGVVGGTMHTVRHAAAQGRPVFCAEPHTVTEKNRGLRVLLDTPANRLWEKLPAWKDAEPLCRRLGSEPLAHPITKDNLDQVMDALGQLVETDPQSVPSERWWPEFASPSEWRERDELERDDAQAPLFAVSD
jgi:DNA processing protein